MRFSYLFFDTNFIDYHNTVEIYDLEGILQYKGELCSFGSIKYSQYEIEELIYNFDTKILQVRIKYNCLEFE